MMNRLFSTVVVALAGIQGLTLEAEARPKLVVGIMVDQLRTDYLDNLRDMFGPGGFRRLIDNGLYLKDIEFKSTPGDATSATAVVQTGDYPRFNGITGNTVFDASTKLRRPVFLDEAYIGNFTNETYSPAALRVTTITDELSVETDGKSRIHSIAPDAAQAIVLAGHTGNSAFWVNDETGRWSSTTYYPNPPAALQNINYNSPLVSRLDTMKWTPLRKGEPYPYVAKSRIDESFRYNFSRSDRDVFTLYKSSPYINSDITQAASDYITTLGLGKNPEGTDVLNLAYTLAPYPAINGENYRYELEDAYLRLDKDLEKLFNVLDRQVGKENVLLYLVSTGYFAEPQSNNPTYKLPGGTFSVKRALSLLNSFLSAKYGNGAYVDHYADRNIYLAKNVLEEKNLHPESVAEEARDFLVKMSGVADAFTLGDLMNPSLKKMEAIRLAIDPKSSGDIILEFNPGWNVVDDSRFPNVSEVNKSTAYASPAFIMGNGIKAEVVEESKDAAVIAPTVARLLRIRSPNSASEKPLSLK